MKEMICICCPLGCRLSVDDSDKNQIKVSGNTCPRGKTYAVQEATQPKRVVTSTVKVVGGEINVASVKTVYPIDKSKIFELLDMLKNVTLTAPVKMFEVVLKDVFGTDVITTRSVGKRMN